jgi:hypothetical protein
MKAEFSCQRPGCSARPQSIRRSGEEGSPPRAPPRYAPPALRGGALLLQRPAARRSVARLRQPDDARRRPQADALDDLFTRSCDKDGKRRW